MFLFLLLNVILFIYYTYRYHNDVIFLWILWKVRHKDVNVLMVRKMLVEYNYEPVDERWAKEILRKTGVKIMLVQDE